MKARQLRTLLTQQLGYEVVKVGKTRGGSHRTMRSNDPSLRQIVFAFHDGADIHPRTVWAILVKQVGLSDERAKEVLKHA